jgi:hypothetical protein
VGRDIRTEGCDRLKGGHPRGPGLAIVVIVVMKSMILLSGVFDYKTLNPISSQEISIHARIYPLFGFFGVIEFENVYIEGLPILAHLAEHNRTCLIKVRI